METVKNKSLSLPCAIIGMGVSGRAVEKLLAAKRLSRGKDYVTFDERNLGADFSDPLKLLKEFQPKTLIVSPGVPLKSPWIQDAHKKGIEISSELSIAATFLQNEKVIAVTGSLGKSTTVGLLGAALTRFSDSGFVGGNLGTPLADYVRAVIEGKRTRADWIVLEVSSYQIENMVDLVVDIAGITHLGPNHLDRYSNLEDYYITKWKLLEIAKTAVALNSCGGDLKKFAQTHPTRHAISWVSAKQSSLSSQQMESALLIGTHNKDNIALAWRIAELADWPPYSVQGLLEFKGLPHRMENLGVRNGIRFINDSKATALESVMTAIEGSLEKLSGSSRLFLLLGGRDKKLPWHKLSPLDTKISPVFFGECGDLARSKTQLNAPVCKKLNEAFHLASQSARPGDTILMSPGGTSLDEFKNFEERGDCFKQLVEEFALNSTPRPAKDNR